MLDYKFNKEQSYRYILKYEIKDNYIYIYYSIEGVEIIPYSLDAERFLLMMMRNQVLNSANGIETRRRQLEKLRRSKLFFLSKKKYQAYSVLIQDYEKHCKYIENEDIIKNELKRLGLNISLNDIENFSVEELQLLINGNYDTEFTRKLRNILCSQK